MECSTDVLQTSMDSEDSHNAEMEPKGNNALDVYIIAYLQTCEVPMGFTPKQHDYVVHKVKWFKCKSNFLL